MYFFKIDAHSARFSTINLFFSGGGKALMVVFRSLICITYLRNKLYNFAGL